MICLNCSNEFDLPTKGSGGQNRLLCYDCLPIGLPRNERNSLRHIAYVKMSNRLKLQLGCSKCGYRKNAAALEWHHTEDDKEHNPSHVLKKSWEAYLAEIEKCELLCSNCHREEHNKDTLT